MSCSCPHPSHFNIKTTIAVDAGTLPFGATHTAFLADGRSVSYTMTSDGTLFETLNKSLDKKISQYLLESEEALNFYYTVLNKQTGIKISFVFIYLVIVSLLLFLSV